MKQWISKLRIRLKLLLAFGSILFMSVLLIAVGIYSINKIISYNDLSERIDGLNISSMQMARHIQTFSEKGFKDVKFLKENKSEFIAGYDKELVNITAELDTLERHHFLDQQTNHANYDTLVQLLDKYTGQVDDLLMVYRERGFQDYGVEGKLRSAIHNVEDADYPYDKATMLMLRRHEKDFFLRKDLKYLDRFNNTINEFKAQFAMADSSQQQGAQRLLALVDKYRSEFNYIVELEKRIGLTNNQGIIGEMNQTYARIETVLNRLTSDIKVAKEHTVNQSMITMAVLFVLQIIIGFALVVVYANMLTKAIKEIKSALVTLSKGAFPKAMAIRTQDEIAEAKNALNNLMERIKSAVNFATDLGKGNFSITYDERYNDDVLASAIIKMKDQLVEADAKQSAINWSNEGMARFSEILKNEADDLEKLGDDIIGQMVQYLKVNQGALYLLDKEVNELERIATYAYHKKKFVDHKLQVGQGLVGQCVLEKDYIHLTDIPADYMKITSGLGEATATSLLLMPLMVREEVMGVIELAAFRPFSSQTIQFVKKASENVANILANKKSAEHTKSLLTEAQHKAETLSAQEEELRQNSEELQATQEEMQRQRQEMEQHIEKLEKQLATKEEEISQILKRLDDKQQKMMLEEVIG